MLYLMDEYGMGARDLEALVLRAGAEVGLAVDPDVDRLALVDEGERLGVHDAPPRGEPLHVAAAVAKAAAVAARGRIARQHMAAADDLLEAGQQVGGCEGGCRWHGRHARTGAPSTSRQRPSGLACCSASGSRASGRSW